MFCLKNKIFCFLILSCLPAKTPFEYTIGITSGYDNNVMRFSSEEFHEAAMDTKLMGGAANFDSFVYRIGISGKKSIWESGKKELFINGMVNWADYRHNLERKYWSGGLDVTYRWGSYKNIKYSLRHLDKFYLRHYVDRDVSTTSLAPCAFTDRNNYVTLTQKFGRGQWVNFGAGYLQRYYDIPFTEFDLDIVYTRGKINKRVKKVGTVAFQFERGHATNVTFEKTAKASGFDRSYETMEWYLPIKVQKRIPFLNEIGVSTRVETRVYEAEDPDDPLHSGRNHVDSKYDLWIKKNLTESMKVTLSGRYRTRVTESVYDWVTDLKSFNQLQFWCKVEWDLVYDRY